MFQPTCTQFGVIVTYEKLRGLCLTASYRDYLLTIHNIYKQLVFLLDTSLTHFIIGLYSTLAYFANAHSPKHST